MFLKNKNLIARIQHYLRIKKNSYFINQRFNLFKWYYLHFNSIKIIEIKLIAHNKILEIT